MNQVSSVSVVVSWREDDSDNEAGNRTATCCSCSKEFEFVVEQDEDGFFSTPSAMLIMREGNMVPICHDCWDGGV